MDSGPYDELSEAEYDRRQGLLFDLFNRMSFRPGTTISYPGISIEVIEKDVPCAYTGKTSDMTWDDQDQGEQLSNAASNRHISDDQLIELGVRAAFRAVANNDLHELCEFFRVDGAMIFDPHPNGSRYAKCPVNLQVLFDDDPAPGPYLHPSGCEYVEVTARTARRIATEMTERVTIGTGRFETAGDHLTHIGVYHDRDSGDRREWSWSREWLCDAAVPVDGNPGAALRSALVTDMFTLAAQSAIHEIAEWLTVDGVRVYEPHPSATGHLDRVRPRLTFDRSPLVAAAA